MKQIPFLKVFGSHFECGKQIGVGYKDKISNYLEMCRKDPPENMTWDSCLDHAKAFLEPTERFFPEIVEEIRGAAEGAGVDFLELFASDIEEFYAKSYHLKACTDVVLLPPASNHTIVAHNNDLSLGIYDMIASVEWNFDDGTQMYTVGIAGIFVSVGVNNSRIVLSGNELTPNDTRTGIPRAIIARAILLATTFDEAVKIGTHTERASSYNNIITAPNQSVSIEGSATNYEFIFPKNGILAHSNHYCSAKMLPYEGHQKYESSIKRLDSANRLASDVKGEIDFITAKTFLSDHGQERVGDNNTVCRHGESAISLFGFAVDLDEGIVELTSGNPCQNPFKKVWRISGRAR